jgi:hypothetical protein
LKKKIIKRRRRRGKSKGTPSKLYFHEGTQEAIIKFQDSECQEEKEKIYVSEILPAFDKLVENLIFIHGFSSNGVSFEELKSDCVTFLYETLKKWDHTRGTKAFSYFNVVAKNWLIIKAKQRTKRNRRHVSIDDTESLAMRDYVKIESHNAEPSQDHRMMKADAMENLNNLLHEIKHKLSGDNEIACMNAIITLFSRIDELDLLNKRAVFVYMRDLSNLNPKQLSISMSVIRKHYRALVKDDEFDIFF